MARNIDYAKIQAERDPALRTGALVMVKDEYQAKARHAPTGVLLVAIADKLDMVNCMEPGGGLKGDHLAYARIPATWLRVIDPREALAPEYRPAEAPARPAPGPS